MAWGDFMMQSTRAARLSALLYDAQGLAFGILMASLGVVFLRAAGLVTGQTAGLSVLLSYVVPLDFGWLFLLVSLPFFGLSLWQKGWNFTLRTIIAVAGISAVTPALSALMRFETLHPLLAAVLAGACCGVGLIALFRHGASAGGLGILALLIEERTGFKAGWFQLGFDLLVFLLAFLALSPLQVLYSFIGALVLNLLVAWNFKAKRNPKSASDNTNVQ